LRACVWAAADGMARGIGFDPELLYVAAMFHDIGLVPAFDSHTVAFEEAAGQVARVFAADAVWPAKRRERLSEVIIRHM
jgi:HD superfamily phosphodiesterase